MTLPCEKNFGALTTAQKAQVRLLGFGKKTWNKDKWHTVKCAWEQLDGKFFGAATALGFTSASWRGKAPKRALDKPQNGASKRQRLDVSLCTSDEDSDSADCEDGSPAWHIDPGTFTQVRDDM